MWVYESGAGTCVPQSAYRHQKVIGSLPPCKFWGSSLDCQAWQHLTHTEFLLQPASLSFDTRSLTRPWTLKPSKPQKSASVHLPRAGVRGQLLSTCPGLGSWVTSHRLLCGFWELSSSPKLPPCPFLFLLNGHALSPPPSMTSVNMQTQLPESLDLCIFLYRSFSQK